MNITDWKVKSELRLGTVVIKLYTVPAGTECNRNIVCENAQGDIVWRVADVLPGQDSPFMNIKAYDDEKIIAYNWSGMNYYINIKTGEASIANPEQRPW
jgi:hypothetical protein